MARQNPISVSTVVQNQSTTATLRIPGTDLNLGYDSRQLRGDVRNTTVEIDLSPYTTGLLGHVVEVDIAGQHHEVELDTSKDSYVFQWDGTDGQGRPVQGTEWARVRVGNKYTPVYTRPSSATGTTGSVGTGGPVTNGLTQTFGKRGSVEISQSTGREPITIWRTFRVELRYARASALGFGGWSASLQRDPLWLDDHEQRVNTRVVEDVFPNADPEIGGTGTREMLAFGPDGTLYTADSRSLFAVDREYALEKTTVPSTKVTEQSPFVSTIVDSPDPLDDVRRIAAGPGGSVYAADPDAYAVFRIDPETGSVTRIAGTGNEPTNDDSSVALLANQDVGEATATPVRPMDVAVGPEGSVYFVDCVDTWDGFEGKAIRRITQSGRLETVAGAPIDGDADVSAGPNVDGTFDPAPTDVQFASIEHLAVDDEGTVYFAHDNQGYGSNAVLSVRPDGVLRLVTGSLDDYVSVPVNDGTRAADAKYGYIGDLSVTEDGDLLVSDITTEVVQQVTPNGTVRRVLGNGPNAEPPLTSGQPSTGGKASLDNTDIAVASDGTFLFGTVYGELGDLSRVNTEYTTGELVPDAAGRTAARITDRHVETIDTYTGGTKRTLEYDGEGRVAAFVDAYGNRTTVARTADGRLDAIEAPNGQRTTFETDDNGYLSKATLPDGRTIALTYSPSGLLQRVEDAAGNVDTFSYDQAGRVTDRTDPTGATTTFVRTEFAAGAEVKRISPEMREVTHRSEWDGEARKFTTTCCSGTSSSTRVTSGESWEVTRRDGGTRTLEQGPDPRFGMAAPVTEEAVEASPSGRQTTTKTERSVSLSDVGDPLSVESHTDTMTVNGRVFEHAFDAATNEFTITTPEGRTTVVTLDGNGDPTEVSTDGVAPVSVERNGMGRIESRTQDGAVFGFEYDADDYLEAVVDETGRRTEFDRDVTGRIQGTTVAAGTAEAATETFGYDDAGNLSEVVRPDGDVHGFGHDAAGRLTGYEPPERPDGDGLSLTYDDDGLVTEFSPPSGRTMTNAYDAGGRRISTSPKASGTGLPTISYDRDGAGRVKQLTWSPDGGSDQTVSIERDGHAVTALEYGGAVSGRFEYDVDANGFVTGITFPADVGGSTTHSLSHDGDGLTTGYGPFTLTRDGPDGAPTKITDGTLTITYTYDARGRVDTRTHSANGTTFYEVDYAYDDAGRIDTRTQTVGGGALPQETFSYDEAGRLDGRTGGYTPDESYDYDANGNCTTRTIGSTALAGTYRSGDRLDAHDHPGSPSVSYAYDADGFVGGRGGDTFTYSPKGQLLEATPDGGSTVTYANDAHGRLVGRTANGKTTDYLYGDPKRPSQLTVARDPDGTRTRYYYDPFGRLIAFDRNGTWYYVATDQVGSPRVVAATDGSIEKEITRDSYGAVLDDSDPGFRLHVGFAGGVKDPDTGLVRMGVRDYEPETGRFTARDPILMGGGQFNYYAYANGDPVNAVDRTGLSSCWWQETLEDYNMTMDYVSPVRNAISMISGDTTAPQGGVESTLKNGVKTGLKEGAKEGIEQLAKGAGRTAAASAAGSTAASAGAAAIWQGAVLEASLRGSILATSGVSNLSDISVTDGIASTLFEVDPFNIQTVDDPENPFLDPGGSDCGQKSPDNC